MVSIKGLSARNEVKAGYKLTEAGIIPEDWAVKELSEILKFGSGKDYKHLSLGDYPVYGTGGVMTHVDSFLYEGESVGLGRKGTIDKPVFLNGRFWTVDTLFYTHTFNKVLPKFVYYKFLQIKWKEYNEASGVPSLNKNTLDKIKIALPPLPEQTAIANTLSDMDALIAQTEKLIEKKKAIKQGVMQELLKPKEGWVTKKLGDLVDKVTTGKLDANAMKPDGEYRFYTCAKEYYFIDRYSFDDEALLISGNGANVGYIHYYKGKFNAYQRTYVLIGFQIDVSFLKIYLDKYLADRITTEVSAGNTPYIKMDTITEMVVQYPIATCEQSAISNQINDINKEIELIEIKLQKLKFQKQGMMQTLLTGKIRLL